MNKEDFTVFVGNLSEKVDEEILFELFLQAGPLNEVRIPCNNGVRKSFGFVEFKHEISVPYALRLLDNTKLFGRAIKLNSRSQYLHLYKPPPPQRIAIKENHGYLQQSTQSNESSLRMMGGGLGRKFMDKSMMPGRPPRKNNKRDDSLQPDKTWGNSWQPKEYPSQNVENKTSRRSHKRGDDYQADRKGDNSWQQNEYPSQNQERKSSQRDNYNNNPRNRNKFEGISHHSRNLHQKTPYYNEKHHNRDKNRHDSYSSQRPRNNRPFTR